MTVWIIEPHDPLIVRDGRPFGPNPGAQATSLSFPFPSTITGGVRTRAGTDANGAFDTDKIQRVKTIKVRGPLLVQLESDANNSEPGEWLVPAPADALLFDQQQGLLCKQLVPLERPSGALIDLDSMDSHKSDSLMLVGLPNPDPHKPSKKAPHYWKWQIFQNWLLAPSRCNETSIDLSTLGHDGPQRERRIHVSMDPDRLVGKDGALFATSGLEFTYTVTNAEQKRSLKRLALAVAVDNGADPDLAVQEGFASLGGERRIVSWHKSTNDLPQWPEELQEAIIKNRACRVLLLTPACFEKGYLPKWVLEESNGVKPHLTAIAIQRPQVVSGWDFEYRQPKPTRRLVPAGTVLFLSFEGSEEARRNWAKSKWMQCISDNEQDRNDGFGLAVLGTWSGKPEKMQ